MAVVVVGDFEDCDSIVDMVKESLESCQPHGAEEKPELPRQVSHSCSHVPLELT